MIDMGGMIEGVAWVPGPPEKKTFGRNAVTGIVVHSAEGYTPGMKNALLDVREPLSKRVSWHLSVYKDGRVAQHYSLRAVAWHAVAMNPFTVGVECEGKADEPLTDAQVASVVRIIKDVGEWQQWSAIMRPADKADRDAELWEHNEGIRFGGSPTACPSGRIPWDKILTGLYEEPGMDEETKRLLADREGRVVLGWLLTKHFNTRLSTDTKHLLVYDPVSGVVAASIPVPSLP